MRRRQVVATDERVADVTLAGDSLTVSLMDGRSISVPLAWYPRLLHATAAQRGHWKIAGGGYGIHWPDIDEDLSTEGQLSGVAAPQNPAKFAGYRQSKYSTSEITSQQTALW